MQNKIVNNDNLSIDQRLINAGIKTIYPDNFQFSRREKRWNEIKLIYNGKEIFRPKAQSCINVVKREFNINI